MRSQQKACEKFSELVNKISISHIIPLVGLWFASEASRSFGIFYYYWNARLWSLHWISQRNEKVELLEESMQIKSGKAGWTD